MLFDLRGQGRRRVIKVVYVTLAFLMGGGLVFFGIGGDVSGGLVDAITERGGGTADDNRFKQREATALAKTRTNPKDEQAWVDLARARYQLATQDGLDAETGAFTAEGTAKLRAAKAAWERYLALEPKEPDERLARVMVQVFQGLNDPDGAVGAQEVIAEANPKNPNNYAILATFAWAAGQTRKGDLARDKAIELTEPDMREALKGQLESARTESITSTLGQSGSP